jgi:hypothetical protein
MPSFDGAFVERSVAEPPTADARHVKKDIHTP